MKIDYFAVLCDNCISFGHAFFFFLKQGSTLRKRKMYEEFLSKVSILGEFGKLYEELINWRICDTWHSFFT